MKKILLFFTALSMVIVLSACQPVESMIDQILAHFSSETEENNFNEAEPEVVAEEVSDENNSEANSEANEAAPVNEVAETIPFDEKLAADGYDNLIVPNGFDLQVPYHFILVEDNVADPAMDKNYQGKFCYQLPMLENHEVAEYVMANNATTGETVSSLGTEDYDYELIFSTEAGLEAGLFFYVDEFDNDCVDVELAYNHPIVDSGDQVWTGPGEDPSTMVSEEELAEMEAYAETEDGQVDENHEPSSEAMPAYAQAEARETAVFQGYEERLARLASDADYFNLENDEAILSTIDTLTEDPGQLAFIGKGNPEIIPYEWYPVRFENQAAGWVGNFCTDQSFSQAVVKHHAMLSEMYADISALEMSNPPENGNYVYNKFAFNDIFGTGSWQGESVFYVEDGTFTSPIENHQCVQLNMTFAADRLD